MTDLRHDHASALKTILSKVVAVLRANAVLSLAQHGGGGGGGTDSHVRDRLTPSLLNEVMHFFLRNPEQLLVPPLRYGLVSTRVRKWSVRGIRGVPEFMGELILEALLRQLVEDLDLTQHVGGVAATATTPCSDSASGGDCALHDEMARVHDNTAAYCTLFAQFRSIHPMPDELDTLVVNALRSHAGGGGGGRLHRCSEAEAAASARYSTSVPLRRHEEARSYPLPLSHWTFAELTEDPALLTALFQHCEGGILLVPTFVSLILQVTRRVLVAADKHMDSRVKLLFRAGNNNSTGPTEGGGGGGGGGVASSSSEGLSLLPKLMLLHTLFDKLCVPLLVNDYNGSGSGSGDELDNTENRTDSRDACYDTATLVWHRSATSRDDVVRDDAGR